MQDIIRNGVVGLVIGAVFASIVFFIGDAVSGPFEVTPIGQDETITVAVPSVVFATIVGGIIGMVLAIVASFLPRPRQIFRGACLVGLVVLAVSAFGASEAFETGVWLNVMHVGAAVPIVGRLTEGLPERRGGDG